MTETVYTMKEAPASFDSHWADVVLYRDDAAILHEFLPQGAQVQPHAVPHRVFIVVLQGTVEITSGPLDYKAYKAGTVVEIPPGDTAGVRNQEAETAEFFVFKTGA